MNYSWFHSLRFRFLIGSIVLLLLLFGLLAFHAHQTLSTFALVNTRTLIKQTSETLNLAVVPHTTSEELETLEAYLNELVTGEEYGIIYLALVDEKGQILVSNRSMPDPLPPAGTDLEQQLQTGIVHVSQSILLADNRIGQLRYGLSTRLLNEAHEAFIQEYLALLVGGLIVVIVILMVIGLRVGAQLGQLMQASKVLASGNYETRTYVSGRNELSHLGYSFNQMADAVAERTEALQERERELNTIIESIPNMIFLKDARELRFVRLNRAGEELLGIPGENIIGKNDYDFFSIEQAEFFTNKDREVLDSGKLMDIPEELIETPSGKRILHTRKVAILGEQGEARYLLGISEDITERKQAEEEINRFKSTLDKTLDCVFLFDPDSLRFIYVNQGAQDQVGYGKNELMEMTPVDITPEFDEPKFRKLLEPLISGEENAITFETVHQHMDGHHLPVEVFLQYIAPNNEAASFVAIVRDITERKLAEEASRCHQRELAHVHRLGTMGEMATGIAHELNQPLTALISYCGTAASLVNSLPSPPQQLSEILELATKQAHRAGDIIKNLREFVSKESKNKETFEIDRVIYEIVTFLKSEVQKSGVKFELQLGGRAGKITANRVQIEQVLVNLVRNSLEALEDTMSVDGRVGIQTRLLPNDMVEVIVTDNGPGIDAALADKIFDQFQTSKEEGMGIGLSLSRSIIEAHGGKLWVDKEHQNGALFAFELPVSE
jgi:two-component system sensor kinase FixL